MPSTFSDLKIELMATGEKNTTWGDISNANWDAVEQAICGIGTVTFASADVTLTLVDTNSAQTGRAFRLNLVGTTGGAPRSLILGAGMQIEKMYLISNQCGDQITVKNPTGPGYAVPAGQNILVYNDGTGLASALTTLAGPAFVANYLIKADANKMLVSSTLVQENATGVGIGGAVNSDRMLTVRKDAPAGGTKLSFINDTAAGAGWVQQSMTNTAGGGNLTLYSFGPNFAPAVLQKPNSCMVQADGSNGLDISTTTGPIRFDTLEQERMRVTEGGDVAIGIAVPQSKFCVSGTTTWPRISVNKQGVASWYMGPNDPSNSWALTMNANAAFITVDTTGNLAVGSTAIKGRINFAGQTNSNVLPVLGTIDVNSVMVLSNLQNTYGLNFVPSSSGNFAIQSQYFDGTVTPLPLSINPRGGTVVCGGNFQATAGMSVIGNLGVTGSISAAGARSLSMNPTNGFLSMQGDAGGYTLGTNFYGSAGTYRCSFGVLGSGDNITYMYIGASYNDTTSLKVFPAGNVSIGSNTGTPAETLLVTGTLRTSAFIGCGVAGNGAVTLNPAGPPSTGYIGFFNSTGTRLGYMGNQAVAAGSGIFYNNENAGNHVFNNSILPTTDATGLVGSGSFRFSAVWAINGAIQTSDEREKTWRGPANEAEIRAAGRIIDELGFFQWASGIDDQLHFGVKAQAVLQIMIDEGLEEPFDFAVSRDVYLPETPTFNYAFITFDSWDASETPAPPPVQTAEDPEPKEQDVVTHPAGNRFGMNYAELGLFVATAQHARMNALEARLTAAGI